MRPRRYSSYPALLIINQVAIEAAVRMDIFDAILRQVLAGVVFELDDPGHTLDVILSRSLDRNFAVPSDAQYRYATLISRSLGIELTDEVLASRVDCHEFISLYADDYLAKVAPSRPRGTK